MVPTDDTSRPSRPCRRAASPFRYSAAVSGAGEIQPILEFIGRRLLRRIDPRSRLGRRLLTTGRVSLWCEPVAHGEQLPVADVLGRLHDQARREMGVAGGPRGWDRICRHRLETIESWQAFYRSDPVTGH